MTSGFWEIALSLMVGVELGDGCGFGVALPLGKDVDRRFDQGVAAVVVEQAA